MKVITTPVGQAVDLNITNAVKPIILNQRKYYSLNLLFPKNSSNLTDLIDEINQAINDQWPQEIPPNLKHPLKNGDSKLPLLSSSAELPNPKYKNAWIINAKSYQKPKIVDYRKQPQDRTPITLPEGHNCKLHLGIQTFKGSWIGYETNHSPNAVWFIINHIELAAPYQID